MRGQGVYIVALRATEASSSGESEPTTRRAPLVALLPWGDIFYDFLDRLGVSLEVLRDEFVGSWLFGYAAALDRAGVRTLIVCPTTHVRSTVRMNHVPTGAELVLLPASRGFSALRRRRLQGRLAGRRDPTSIARAVAAHAAPYLGLPPVAFVRLVRSERCDAVLCQDYEDPRFDVCVALGRVLRVPVFGTFQGADYQLSKLEGPVRPLTIRASAGLVVGAEVEADRVQREYGVPDAKLARIVNPVDLDVWHPVDRVGARAALGIPNDASVAVWHGQLQVWRKGLDVLLDAWASATAVREGRDLRLLLVGSGEDVSEVRRRLEGPGLAGVTLLDEWVRDRGRLRTILSAADVYVFPSRHEGLPVAPLEAMACGLPVVGAAARGMHDVVGEAGIVVPSGDAGAFAAVLGSLLDDDERREALGRLARRRAETLFSLEAVGGRLRAFLVDRSGS